MLGLRWYFFHTKLLLAVNAETLGRTGWLSRKNVALLIIRTAQKFSLMFGRWKETGNQSKLVDFLVPEIVLFVGRDKLLLTGLAVRGACQKSSLG